MNRRRLVPFVTAALIAAVAVSAAPPALAATQQEVVVTPAFVRLVTGTPQSLTFTAQGPGDPPVAFHYTFGAGAPVEVPATAGTATVSVNPIARVEALDVQTVAPDGTLGLHTFIRYFARAGSPAADKDLNGDGRPDLLTPGGSKGLTSGLWQALGTNRAGQLGLPATMVLDGTNIGGGPDFYDEAELVTGNFTGSGFQDVLPYFSTGFRSGEGLVIGGQGDGSPLYDLDGTLISVGSLTDAEGHDPLEVVNSYEHASGLDGLIGRTATALDVYPSAPCPACYFTNLHANVSTPDGTTNWGSWRIATARGATGASMLLWKPSTGALYLWTGLTFTDNGDGTAAASYTPYLVARHWKQGATFRTFEAADFSGDGIPDIWTVNQQGIAQAFEITGLSRHGAARIVAHKGQPLG